MPIDKFQNLNQSLISPGYSLELVTKNDTVDLPNGIAKSLLVGTAGTCNLIDASGITRNNVPLQQGYNPIRVIRVLTGGTATDIWAIY
jgi:hypothetical protein